MGRTLESLLDQCLANGVSSGRFTVEAIGDTKVLTLNAANVVDEPLSFIVRRNDANPCLCPWLEPEKL